MGSNRIIQTILQAIMVVLLATITVSLSSNRSPAGRDGGHESVPDLPPDDVIKRCFRAYFSEDKEASSKTEGLTVAVKDISVEGPIAHVKLQIRFKWVGQAPLQPYAEGPLKNAPGNRGETVEYTEVFKFRRWTKGWDIEGRREPAIIQ
jgi:hypothetical protein